MPAGIGHKTSVDDRFQFERGQYAAGATRLAGVDEAGRGPLAGPVVAAAAVLPRQWTVEGMPESLQRLNDSKQLTEKIRDQLFAAIHAEREIHFGVGIIDAGEIDRINILQAQPDLVVFDLHLCDPFRTLSDLCSQPDHTHAA